MLSDNKSDSRQVVVFRAGQSEYGADIREVREIIRLEGVTSIPGSAQHFDGIINVRGEIIPLVNLRSLTGIPLKPTDSETRVLIVDGNPAFGLIVDMVGEVKSVSWGAIEPLPHIVGCRIDNDLFTGICKLPDRMLILMDLRRVINKKIEAEKAPEAAKPAGTAPETPTAAATPAAAPAPERSAPVTATAPAPAPAPAPVKVTTTAPVAADLAQGGSPSPAPGQGEELMPKEFRQTGVISGRPEEPAIEMLVNNKKVTEIHLDALRELGNIGTSHSATSLSMLVNSPINMSVPNIKFVSINNISGIMSESRVVGLLLELKEGESTSGFLYNLFPEQSALRIVDKLMGLEMGTTKELDEMGQSAIMEVGNIITSSFCDAVADFLGMSLIPSPPNFVFDMADSIIQNTIVEIGMMADDVIIFKTDLADDEHIFEGFVMFFPNPDTLDRILSILDAKLGL